MKYILKIDLDFKIKEWGWEKDYLKMAKAVLNAFDCKIDDVISKKSSKRGYHYWFHISTNNELTPEKLNMLQWMLNDDWGRVVINQWRIKRGDDWKRGNKLFSRVLYRKEIDEKCKRCKKHLLYVKIMEELNA